jgi:hypothetical protein
MLTGFSTINHPLWCTPIYGNHHVPIMKHVDRRPVVPGHEVLMVMMAMNTTRYIYIWHNDCDHANAVYLQKKIRNDHE